MFAAPSLLAWGALATALAALFYRLGSGRRAAATAKMGRLATLSRLIPAETSGRRAVKAWLSCAALALLFVALACPQWGVELAPTESKARGVVIAVDLSLSMLAEDVKPSRLEKAKEELSLLLDQLKGERVGVLGFAGDAFMMCPMTTDIDAAKQILRGLSPDSIPVPGTAIGGAVRAATRQLARYGGERTLVLITDGEDHQHALDQAAAEAADNGVKIYAIGIGSQDGEPIPIKDDAGNLQGYKKDKRGATVVSKLGDALLTQATQKTGGAYYRATPGEDEVNEIVQKIERGEKGEAVQGTASHYRNRFMLPLALAFLLLLVELLIPEKRALPPISRFGKIISHVADVGAKKALVPIVLLILGTSAAQAATAEGALRRGNKLYQTDQFEPALEQYAAAGAKSPKDARPVFNAGYALYRLQRLDEASQAFKAVAESKLPPDARAAAYYNLGNARYQAGDLAGAIDAYRKAVVLDPADEEARHNLAVALKNQKNPPPKKKDQDKKQDKKKDQPDKDKPQPSGGQNNADKGRPPETKTRPQDQMSREDAERIMRAVADKERSASKQLQLQKQPVKKPDVEEDW